MNQPCSVLRAGLFIRRVPEGRQENLLIFWHTDAGKVAVGREGQILAALCQIYDQIRL
jgi:hypothetical protein